MASVRLVLSRCTGVEGRLMSKADFRRTTGATADDDVAAADAVH